MGLLGSRGVDVHGVGYARRSWRPALEPVRVALEGGLERSCAGGSDGRCLAAVERDRRHRADAGVAVVVVVVLEERREHFPAVLDAGEQLWEGRRGLGGLEQAFAEPVVVAGAGSRESGLDARVDQQFGQGLGAHRRAAIGVQGPVSGRHRLTLDAALDQLAGQCGGLAGADHPADHVSAEDVDHHKQVQAGPLDSDLELGDVPGPQLVRCVGEQLGSGVDRMPALVAPFADGRLCRSLSRLLAPHSKFKRPVSGCRRQALLSPSHPAIHTP